LLGGVEPSIELDQALHEAVLSVPLEHEETNGKDYQDAYNQEENGDTTHSSTVWGVGQSFIWRATETYQIFIVIKDGVLTACECGQSNIKALILFAQISINYDRHVDQALLACLGENVSDVEVQIGWITFSVFGKSHLHGDTQLLSDLGARAPFNQATGRLDCLFELLLLALHTFNIFTDHGHEVVCMLWLIRIEIVSNVTLLHEFYF